MLLQSILVYSTLMTIMILFGISASNKRSYSGINEDKILYNSFLRFDTIAPLLLFAIIFGMRYDVGTDQLGYLEGYLWKEYVGKTEPLFFLFSDIGWFFNFHYAVYFALLAFVQIFFFFYAFKVERYLYPFLVFFIFTEGTVFFWMNGIRQAMAICIWIYSLRYIKEKKLISYLIWVLVSVLVHKSAIILFIFYPILRNGKDYFKSVPMQLIFLGTAFTMKALFFKVIMSFESIINFYISLLGSDIYQQRYGVEGLIDGFTEAKGSGLAYFFKIGVNILIIFYSTKLKEFYNNKWFNMVYFFFFLGLVIFYMFPVGAVVFIRPFHYFFIFQSIMYSYFGFYLYKKSKDGRKLLLLLLLIISFSSIFFLSQYTANSESSLLYQFYFQHNINGYPK